jgi:phosphoserine phosphatase
MGAQPGHHVLTARDLEPILAVAAKLATPFDLGTMLREVVNAAKQVLGAERGSVWLYDPETDELVLEIATGIDPVRVASGTGLVGSCARHRNIINVHDCYSDARFDPETDRRSGYRTRCMLTLPLIGHDATLVGVMQVLNKADGTFGNEDEALATVLAAQCAIALQRVRMTEAVIEGEKLRQQLEMARVVQMSSLPRTMPEVAGYDVYGTFKPADLTGGDTFDLSRVGDDLVVVLADATGHGIAPALSVTQMQAMLRMALRLGASLEEAYTQVNDQLAEILPGDRFITAFIGILDPATHRVRFHSGGQGPILHFHAAANESTHHKPTSFPLAAMPITRLRPAVVLDLAPGDILALVSDGIFEYRNAQGEEFGEARVRHLLATHHARPAAEISALLFAAVQDFARKAPQEDDMTVVLVKRAAA